MCENMSTYCVSITSTKITKGRKKMFKPCNVLLQCKDYIIKVCIFMIFIRPKKKYVFKISVTDGEVEGKEEVILKGKDLRG